MRIVIFIIGTLLLRFIMLVLTHCEYATINTSTIFRDELAFFAVHKHTHTLTLTHAYHAWQKRHFSLALQRSSHTFFFCFSQRHALKCTKGSVLLSQIYSISIDVRNLSVFLFGFRIIACINPLRKVSIHIVHLIIKSMEIPHSHKPQQSHFFYQLEFALFKNSAELKKSI